MSDKKEKDSETHLLLKFKETNTDKNLVFGWASVAETSDGSVVKDLQDDIIKVEELEKGAYRFVKNSRTAGEMHERIGVGSLVESMVFTKDKQKALGIPEGTMPVGWWVGFEVTPDVFAKIKSGEYKAFSIGGRGQRTKVGE